MMIRLGFAVSTCIPPEILVMDEWLSAGDASFLEKAQRRMETFVGSSSILVLASHSTRPAAQVVQSGYLASARTDRSAGDINDVIGAYTRCGGAAHGGCEDTSPRRQTRNEHGRGRSLQLQSVQGTCPTRLAIWVCSQTRPDQILLWSTTVRPDDSWNIIQGFARDHPNLRAHANGRNLGSKLSIGRPQRVRLRLPGLGCGRRSAAADISRAQYDDPCRSPGCRTELFRKSWCSRA